MLVPWVSGSSSGRICISHERKRMRCFHTCATIQLNLEHDDGGSASADAVVLLKYMLFQIGVLARKMAIAVFARLYEDHRAR